MHGRVDRYPAPRDPSQKFWDPKVQTLPPEKLRTLQNRRLRDVLKRALEKPVPFFERKLKEAGIADARDVRGVGDIEKLPLTIKQELRDSETAVPPVGDYRYTDIRDCIRI